ncbi:MAG: phosphopentomutase [Lachnospiraceae bacterium]|nr:phosphopentomutase [Lachnospiraceae bacterium]
MAKRVILIVMDSFGIGAEPDAEAFGDKGTNTLGSCTKSELFRATNLARLGLFGIDGVETARRLPEQDINITGTYARLRESSMGKDTTIGHWEIAGLISPEPLPTYPDGFPADVIEAFEKKVGRKILCNLPYSGTKVINDYGDEHVKTGKLIVYTSADSVFQIAAHEDIVPVEELYDICRDARNLLTGKHGVGRVIARPFTGTSGNYMRTTRRHDFSLLPPKDTMLDVLSSNGKDVIGIGKINDIFAGKGITEYTYTSGNEDGINKTIEYLDRDFNGLLFVNLVDYDMLYGHRRDIDGYAKAVAYFDDRLPEIVSKLTDEDILMITADHGCDPGYTATTDHTREYVPLLCCGPEFMPAKGTKAGNLGTRPTFADIAGSVLSYLDLPEEERSRIAGTDILRNVTE